MAYLTSASSSAINAIHNASNSQYHYLGVVEFTLGGVDRRLVDEQVKKATVTAAASPSDTLTVNTNASTSSSGDELRSIEERIIDQLDHAQLCGEITRQPTEETNLVFVVVSTNGVKFLDVHDQHAVERLAMHKIVQCLSYENEIGSCNVAVVVTKTDSILLCYLLQTENHNDADQLCERILGAFQTLEQEAGTKTREERERRRSELEQKRRLRQNNRTQ